jgi:hypothetical protein
MPAAHLYQLFAHEDAIQTATVALLTAAGLTPVYTRGDTAALADTGYLVRFTRGPASGSMQKIPAAALTAISNRVEFSGYTGTLDIAVVVARPANLPVTGLPAIRTTLGQRVGRVSAALLRSTLPFTTTNLPFHDVSEILPQAAEWGTDEDHDLDICRLSWQLTYAIRADAWPLAPVAP